MQNSQQFEVGDRVYCMVMGQYGTVIEVDKDRYKRLTVQFEFDDVKYRFYKLDGKYADASKAPCLFFDKPQFEVPKKPFKPTYKPGTILCMRHKVAACSFRVLEVLGTELIDTSEIINARCFASSYPGEVSQNINGIMLHHYDTQVISEPSE